MTVKTTITCTTLVDHVEIENLIRQHVVANWHNSYPPAPDQLAVEFEIEPADEAGSPPVLMGASATFTENLGASHDD